MHSHAQLRHRQRHANSHIEQSEGPCNSPCRSGGCACRNYHPARCRLFTEKNLSCIHQCIQVLYFRICPCGDSCGDHAMIYGCWHTCISQAQCAVHGIVLLMLRFHTIRLRGTSDLTALEECNYLVATGFSRIDPLTEAILFTAF